MYTFKTSERNNDKATEFETKSLLYLMTNAPDSDNVDLFIIDCFNDVTGTSANFSHSCIFGPSGETRTRGILVPNQAPYQLGHTRI